MKVFKLDTVMNNLQKNTYLAHHAKNNSFGNLFTKNAQKICASKFQLQTFTFYAKLWQDN